jgi:hypothetical protein
MSKHLRLTKFKDIIFLVFFTGKYLVLGGTRLMQRASTVETWDLY